MSRIFAGLSALALLGGCATVPGSDRVAQRDPLERINRGVWGFNRAVDKVVLKPVTTVYRGVAPKPLRSGVSNFFSNVSEPWSFINSLLQAKPDRAAVALKRFVINTVVGIGGLFDVATKAGIKQEPEDFGQTLGRWGVSTGPYLVLPILGPSTLRDGVGTGVAYFGDPYRVCVRDCGLPKGVPTGLTVTQIIDTRSQLTDVGADKLLDSSADSYATARSAYLQRRRAAIADEDDATATTTAAPDPEDFATPGDAAPAAADAGGTPPPASLPDATQPTTAPATAPPPAAEGSPATP